MSSIAAASRKRKLGDELPHDKKRRRHDLPDDIVEDIIRDGQEKMLKLLDGDVVIKCQGREFKGCGVILAAKCKFFEACLSGSFKESDSRVINMDDDDPDALEALIQYLHTSGTMHIQNWKISYENRIKDQEYRDEADLRFSADIIRGDQSGELPQDYLTFLAKVIVLADKYEQPLLAGAVAEMLKLPEKRECAELYELSNKKFYITTARHSEIRKAYANDPIEVVKTLAILSRLPGSCTAKWDAEICVMQFFDDDDFMSFPEPECPSFTDEDPTGAVAGGKKGLRTRLESIVAEDPAIFFTLANYCQALMERKDWLERQNKRLETENYRWRCEDEKRALRHRAKARQRAADESETDRDPEDMASSSIDSDYLPDDLGPVYDILDI